jgi:hypothetical protein
MADRKPRAPRAPKAPRTPEQRRESARKGRETRIQNQMRAFDARLAALPKPPPPTGMERIASRLPSGRMALGGLALAGAGLALHQAIKHGPPKARESHAIGNPTLAQHRTALMGPRDLGDSMLGIAGGTVVGMALGAGAPMAATYGMIGLLGPRAVIGTAAIGGVLGGLFGAAYGSTIDRRKSRTMGPEINGPQGLQSARAAERNGAYLDKDAAARPSSRATTAAPVQQRTQAQPQPTGTQTYTKADGTSVQATAGQAKKWEAQKR